MSFATLTDMYKSYNVSTIQSPVPYYKFWENNPLSNKSWINPREAGFNPYKEVTKIQTIPAWIDSDCPVFQTACSLILPINKCYLQHHEPIIGGTQ